MSAINFLAPVATCATQLPGATGPPAAVAAQPAPAAGFVTAEALRRAVDDSGSGLPPDGNMLPSILAWLPLPAAVPAPSVAPVAAPAVAPEPGGGMSPAWPGQGPAAPVVLPPAPAMADSGAAAMLNPPIDPAGATPGAATAPPASALAAALDPSGMPAAAVDGAALRSPAVAPPPGIEPRTAATPRTPAAATAALAVPPRINPDPTPPVAPVTVPPRVSGRTPTPPAPVIAATATAPQDGTSLPAGQAAADAAAAVDAIEAAAEDTAGRRPATTSPLMPAAMGTAPSAPASPAQGTAMQVAAPVGSEGFADALGERVVAMVDREAGAARLTLNPPQLGPLELRVQVSGEQASVSFTAHNYLTRDVLEQAVPRLRDLLGAHGFVNVNVNVAHHSFSERPAQAMPFEGFAMAPADASAGGRPPAAGRQRLAAGLLDAYA